MDIVHECEPLNRLTESLCLYDNRVYFIVITSLSLISATLEWYIANVPVILASLEFKVIGSFINDNELAEG